MLLQSAINFPFGLLFKRHSLGEVATLPMTDFVGRRPATKRDVVLWGCGLSVDAPQILKHGRGGREERRRRDESREEIVQEEHAKEGLGIPTRRQGKTEARIQSLPSSPSPLQKVAYQA